VREDAEASEHQDPAQRGLSRGRQDDPAPAGDLYRTGRRVLRLPVRAASLPLARVQVRDLEQAAASAGRRDQLPERESVHARDGPRHGLRPSRAPRPIRHAALLLIDVINDLEFPGNDDLVARALPMARRLRALKARARRAGVPAIYINDNFGKWRSDFRTLVAHCVKDNVPGRAVARLLKPGRDDYFVLKPKHSAFYRTTLDLLLASLKVRTVILTGIAGNNCVLFSANDAYMRDLKLVVPAD